MADSPYRIGVDGGGTKTECILVDGRGEIVARHTAPGCNPSQTGPEKARAILAEALAALLVASKIDFQGSTIHPDSPSPLSDLPSPISDLPSSISHLPTPISQFPSAISHTLLCLAGSATFWSEFAASLSGYGQVTTTDDSVPVLELATAGAPGLVLHAGTGSFIAARSPAGEIHYAGGLGWKFGDPGSGFDIGRRALAAALLELQSVPPADAAAPSPLVAALRVHTGLADYAANSRFFYSDPAANAQIAAFAPRVIELAAQDCGPARQAVADSVAELARQADGVLRRLFPSATSLVPCGVSGKILHSAPAAAALRSLAVQLQWPVDLRFIDAPPIEGVRQLLLKS